MESKRDVTRLWDAIINQYLENDTSVSEIQTNGDLSIFLRQGGKRKELPNAFRSMEEYRESIEYLIKRINKFAPENPRFLEEGTIYLNTGGLGRCHIVLPPVSLEPMVTIARKTEDLTTLDDITYSGSMTSQMNQAIKSFVDIDLTITLSGSTGSGKTTMLEAITKLWDPKLRIGVVEDAPELMLIQPNVTYLKSAVAKPGQPENETATLAWCVKQLNRMRVDKMIIGETRGEEFASFLTAANSGNEGSLTTLHANNPRACLQKMNQFINEAQSSPQRVINQNIASTIDIIIQLDKTIDGKYRTTAIEAVSRQLGNDESATIATQPIFTYNEDTDDWTSHTLPDDLRNKLIKHGYDPMTFTKKEVENGQGLFGRPRLGGF